MDSGTLRRTSLLAVLALLVLTLTGGLVLPIAGYVAGKRWIGPYEGKLGLSDYLGSIYAAASQGELLAWWLLLTPALITVLWYVVWRLSRSVARRGRKA